MSCFSRLLTGFFIVLITFQVQAATPEECPDFHVRFGAFHYQRFLGDDGTCFMSADPFDVGNFVYRSYLTTSEGMLMVFNSYNDSQNPDSTGARVFHIFPRGNSPTIEVLPEGVKLKLANETLSLILSTTDTKLIRAEGAKIIEDSAINKQNKGGLEIKNPKTLILDSGFAIGHDVTGDKNRTSKFYDTFGKFCSVKNIEIFNYFSDGDTEFKFTDQELKLFLKKRCPKISFTLSAPE